MKMGYLFFWEALVQVTKDMWWSANVIANMIPQINPIILMLMNFLIKFIPTIYGAKK